MTTIEFRAPWSKTLRGATVLSLVVLALPMLGAIFAPVQPPLLAAVLLIGVPPLIVAATFAGRVRGYTLTEDAITVRRGLSNTRLPLAGLRSVTGDVDAMRGSVRVFGNGGLFSITGRFWNQQAGLVSRLRYGSEPGSRPALSEAHHRHHAARSAALHHARGDVHQGRGISEVATSVRVRGASVSTATPEAATNPASVHNAAA